MTLLSMPHLSICHHTNHHASLLCGVLVSFIVFNQHLSFQHYFFFLRLSLFLKFYILNELFKLSIVSHQNQIHITIDLFWYAMLCKMTTLIWHSTVTNLILANLISFMAREKMSSWGKRSRKRGLPTLYWANN